MIMKWVAYCKTCKRDLVEAENGTYVESVAKSHVKEWETQMGIVKGDHEVIVGYSANKVLREENEEKESKPSGIAPKF
jgi:hypothetical protein